jgi:hypothetical protein
MNSKEDSLRVATAGEPEDSAPALPPSHTFQAFDPHCGRWDNAQRFPAPVIPTLFQTLMVLLVLAMGLLGMWQLPRARKTHA